MLELKFAASLSSHASFLSRCMQYWLKNHGPGFVQTPNQLWMKKTLPVRLVSMHTNRISNSAT